MPTKKLSEIYSSNPADAFDGTEIIEVTQGGVTKGGTTQQLAELAASALGANIDGAVFGPESVTDGNFAAFDGTTGKLVKQLTAAQAATLLGQNVRPKETIYIACSDEATVLNAGTAKVTFRMPYAFTLTEVRASLATAQASGSIFTVDINEGGTSVLSAKLTIDNTEKSSTTAATPAVISDSSLADDAEITVDIDQVGDGTAKGLKIMLIGYRT